MRHLFDQYNQPENRLTHALVCCLREDGKLLNRFVCWLIGLPPPKGRIEIVEQSLPGDVETSEEEAERRGLPDACVFNEDGWALVLEDKIASSLRARQLRQHRATAKRRGFDDIHLAALDTVPPRAHLPRGTAFRTWSEVYRWMHRQAAWSEWASRMRSYMEIAEGRMVADGYLREGTLTVFSGIPFDEQNPYTYREAKRLLKLAMDKLQKRKDLAKQLGVDLKGKRRPAITGEGRAAVWDFLPLRQTRKAGSFVKHPHLTLAIGWSRLEVELIVPNNMKAALRRNLTELGDRRFSEIIETVDKRIEGALRGARGASPAFLVYQRRYPTQSSPAIVDAKLEFDMRTAFVRARGKPRIGYQPQWLEATYRALSKKRSNLQVGIGAILPYGECAVVSSPKVVDVIARVWLATKPVLDTMLGR